MRHNNVFDARSRQSAVYSALVSKASLQRQQKSSSDKMCLTNEVGLPQINEYDIPVVFLNLESFAEDCE